MLGALVALTFPLFPASPANSAAFSAGSQVTTAGSTRRVVAVGDIHGAFDAFIAILQEAGLIDAELHWSGGDTIFVQTGDFTDRGPQVRRCMDFLMGLPEEAKQQGGEVIVLLANHELMNLIWALRDTSPADFEAFVDDESGRRQEEAWQTWERVRTERAKALGLPGPEFTDEVRQSWEGQHPLGFAERMDAFGPEGTYGRWLRKLPTAALVDDTLFMHAGVSLELAGRKVDDINERIWDEVERFDEIRHEMVRRELMTPYATLDEMFLAARDELARMVEEYGPETGNRVNNRELRFSQTLQSIMNISRWQILEPEGFLWFRGLALWTDAEGEEPVAEIVRKQDISHIVVAHTTQLDGIIKARFGGRVFLIDTGMLAEHYGGRPSALEIVDGRFTAIYVGERKQLFPQSAGASGSPQPRVAPASSPAGSGTTGPALTLLGPRGR